jgi:hypothetical protein
MNIAATAVAINDIAGITPIAFSISSTPDNIAFAPFEIKTDPPPIFQIDGGMIAPCDLVAETPVQDCSD